MEASEEFAVVATFSQNVELLFLEGRLEESGVRYYLQGENTVSVNPLLSGAIGGVRLAVHQGDIEVAQEIVREWRREQNEAYERARKTCPECGGENGEEVHRSWLFGVVAVLTLGCLCLLYPWPRYRCPDCGRKWR